MVESKVKKEIIKLPDRKRELRIVPINSFSFKVEWEGGGEVPACLLGEFSFNGAKAAIASFNKTKTKGRF